MLALFFSLSGVSSDNMRLHEFSVVDMQGKTHNNDSVIGKYLVVNFWATWCPPCLREIPDFVEFYEKYKEKVEILGMNYEGVDIDKITEFKDSLGVDYPIILSTSNNRTEFTKFGKILGMPTTYIYAPNGKLITRHLGEIDIETLEKFIH